jgi:putative membrane protein
MKTIKLFFLIGITAFMLSCNNNPNRNKDDKDVNESGMLVRDEDAPAERDIAGSGEAGSGRDEDFVKDVASGGLMELELARLAQQNAQSVRVKNFAAMIVKEHTKANEELRTIASNKNFTFPAAMENTDNSKINDLQEERGADFDRKFMDQMVDDHEKNVDKFKRQAENGSDPELKAFATKILPVLIAHQDSARIIKDALR